MKRELPAAALLLLLIIFSAVNIARVDSLTEEILLETNAALHELERGNTTVALLHWENAFGLWERSYAYSHIFIRHSEIDSAAEDFYSCKELILQGEKEARAAFELLEYRLRCIAGMEKPTPGSIL